jgi:phage terminase large subunit-like protein
MSKMTRGERVIAFAERYLKVPEGDFVGKPIVLEPFQKNFILEVYDNVYGTDTAILSMARKNAKTATIGILVAAHVVGPEAMLNSRIISGALSREQAAEVYNLTSKMLNLSPELEGLYKIIPSSKKIVGLAKNVEYQAISAEAKTSHGKSPVVAILDEVGQIRGDKSDFVDAITTSQGAYDNALLIYISTQAANDNDFFSIQIDDALKNKPNKTVCHLYATDMEADLLDEQAWYKSNPALGKFRSLNDMRKQAEKAERMPSFENTFRNLNLNQRVEQSSPFVSNKVWSLNSGDIDDEVFLNNPVYVGLDLSSKNDLTAMVLIAFDEKWHIKPYFWTPKDGLVERSKRDRAGYDTWAQMGLISPIGTASLDYEILAIEIAEILMPLNVVQVAFDRWRIDLLKKEFERIGADLPLVEFGQGYKDISPAIESLEGLLLNGKMLHGNNPVLKMCAANSKIIMDAAGNRKLDKQKSTGRIDGMVALAMAAGAMSNMLDADNSVPEILFL